METGMTVTQQAVASPTVQAPGVSAGPRDRRKTPAFLSNLGKPTLRGIRRCPQCGVFNGTRGLSCKNKACGVIFRDGGANGGSRGVKKGGAEVVRVVIDGGGGAAGEGGTQVFSLRQRGRGAEQRGFVELVFTDTAIATADGTVLTRVNLGRCFMPACRQGQAQTGAGRVAGQPPESPCVHVKQAMECQAEATPLPLKSSVLESLQAPVQAREELWRLATESPGPLVQRVSRWTLVVKCHASECHPLGLLHLTAGAGPGAARPHAANKEGGQRVGFHCACQAGSVRRGLGARPVEGKSTEPGVVTSLLLDAPPPATPCATEPCLHYHACVCALTSDEKLASEFADFLGASDGPKPKADCTAVCNPGQQQLPESVVLHRPKRIRVEEPPPVTSPSLAGREGSLPPGFRKSSLRKHPITTVLKNSGSSQPVDEGHVSLAFQQWLASVTERIHQTMHYQFDGKPEPLVFHIPQAFFNALQQRLSLGSKKRRLPNSTTAFVRNDALPLGTFSKYTWHITNLLQVKRIFDTPELPLELTQSFVKNRDGSFSPFRCPEVPSEPVTEGFSRGERPQAIRPLELRTFLKVGPSSAEQKGPKPFVIEWIPDILPRSRVGELRIGFEYGHQHSGQREPCDATAARAAEGPAAPGGTGTQAAPQAVQPLAAPTIEIFRVSVP